MAGLTTVVTLTVALILPDRQPILHSEVVESLSLCWAMARELVARAEEGPLRIEGGSFSAGCKVKVAPSVEH